MWRFRKASDSGSLRFERYGSSSYQLCITHPEDLFSIPDLDERLWMATSCPVFGLNGDPVFLRFLDANDHGRILSDEVREAIRWMKDRLMPDVSWTDCRTRLPLRLIRTDHPDGKALYDTARRVLENLDVGEAEGIALDQIRNRQRILAQADQNGDGVIPPEVVADPDAARLVRDIMGACGSVPDSGGLQGIDQALLDRFLKESKAYINWHGQGVLPGLQTQSEVLPFGEETSAMWDAVAAVRNQVDQFFTQCAFVRFDPRAADQFALRDDELMSFQYGDRQAILARLREAPIHPPNREGVLRFEDRVNEMYREAVGRLRTQVVMPVIGETTEIDQTQWQTIVAKFDVYNRWLAARPDTPVEKLGCDRLREIMDAPHTVAAIRSLIDQDKAVSTELARLHNLEKLILYHQWLFHFVNNYVSLPWLFDPQAYAMFEMGTLVLGGREFATSFRVGNRGAHAVIAQHSNLFMLYLAVTGPNPEDNLEVVTPVTRGNPDIYYVGQRGVFFTTTGRQLDAQIVQIVENPISLRQSMLAPFRRIRDVLSQRFEQLTVSIQKQAEGSVVSASSTVETTVQQGVREAPAQAESAPAPPPQAPTPAAETGGHEAQRASGTTRDLLIGAGFLLAGLGTAFKFLVDTMRQLGDPDTLSTVILISSVLIAVVVLLTALNAWRKLRLRDLAGILQACGWAMNARLRVNRKMVRFFVRPAMLPSDARKYRRDRLSYHLSRLRRLEKNDYALSRRKRMT